MKKLFLFFVLWSAIRSLCAQGSSLAGDSRQNHFGHFLFRIPDGWRSSQAGYFMMAPTDLAAGQLLTYILLPPLSESEFSRAAETTIYEVAFSLGAKPVREGFGPGPLYVKENEGRHAKGWDYSLGHGLAQAVAGKDAVGLDQIVVYYFGLFLVKVNGRMERAVYISKDFRSNFQTCRTYLNPAYQPVINNFFFDLEFDDWADGNKYPGRITHAGICDVWTGLAYFEGSTGQALFEGSVKATYLVFFDNGQVYYNKELPKQGLHHVNSFTESGHHPRWWGTYTYHDGAGEIRLSYLTIPFSLRDGKLYLEMYKTNIPYGRNVVADGMTLDGSWTESATGLGKPAGIRLSADGRFSDGGVILRIEHPVDNCFRTIPGEGQGSYEIRGNSICFRYDNGFAYQAAFSGLNLRVGDRSPQQLCLGFHDDVFTRK